MACFVCRKTVEHAGLLSHPRGMLTFELTTEKRVKKAFACDGRAAERRNQQSAKSLSTGMEEKTELETLMGRLWILNKRLDDISVRKNILSDAVNVKTRKIAALRQALDSIYALKNVDNPSYLGTTTDQSQARILDDVHEDTSVRKAGAMLTCLDAECFEEHTPAIDYAGIRPIRFLQDREGHSVSHFLQSPCDIMKSTIQERRDFDSVQIFSGYECPLYTNIAGMGGFRGPRYASGARLNAIANITCPSDEVRKIPGARPQTFDIQTSQYFNKKVIDPDIEHDRVSTFGTALNASLLADPNILSCVRANVPSQLRQMNGKSKNLNVLSTLKAIDDASGVAKAEGLLTNSYNIVDREHCYGETAFYCAELEGDGIEYGTTDGKYVSRLPTDILSASGSLQSDIKHKYASVIDPTGICVGKYPLFRRLSIVNNTNICQAVKLLTGREESDAADSYQQPTNFQSGAPILLHTLARQKAETKKFLLETRAFSRSAQERGDNLCFAKHLEHLKHKPISAQIDSLYKYSADFSQSPGWIETHSRHLTLIQNIQGFLRRHYDKHIIMRLEKLPLPICLKPNRELHTTLRFGFTRLPGFDASTLRTMLSMHREADSFNDKILSAGDALPSEKNS